MKAESDLIAAHRKIMADKGALDEYNRAANYLENAGIVARFLKEKFEKRNNERIL